MTQVQRLNCVKLQFVFLSLLCLLSLTACESEEGLLPPLAPPPPITSGDPVLIPAGEVVLGDVPIGWGNYLLTNGANPAYVEAFYLDRWEVSNAQYAAFLNAALDSGLVLYQNGNVYDVASQTLLLKTSSTDCKILWQATSGSFAALPVYAQWPVVEVSWYGAVAYAQFYGKRLPGEVEWEKAARGDADVLGSWCGVGIGYPYPWGNNEPDHTLANYDGFLTAPENVQSYPAGMSWFGVFNMGGNVWEWTATSEGGKKVRRGGSYLSPPEYLKTGARFFSDPLSTEKTLGFRCAADL